MDVAVHAMVGRGGMRGREQEKAWAGGRMHALGVVKAALQKLYSGCCAALLVSEPRRRPGEAKRTKERELTRNNGKRDGGGGGVWTEEKPQLSTRGRREGA